MWSHPYSGCQLMPIITMSSASFKFYLLSLIFICALSWSTGMPAMMERSNCKLSFQEREEIYKRLPPVYDERLADAESNYAYDLCKFRRP